MRSAKPHTAADSKQTLVHSVHVWPIGTLSPPGGAPILFGPAGLAMPGGPGGMKPGMAGRAAPVDPGPELGTAAAGAAAGCCCCNG